MAHAYWARHLQPSDTAIDATCGNGKDATYLLALLPKGKVFALDIQLQAHAPEGVIFLHQCHTKLPEDPFLRLIVYNLGYLPGGDKTITTRAETTLKSVQLGFERLPTGGALSIVCYPHEEGTRESDALLTWASVIPAKVEHHVFREGSPSFLWIVKL